jgi:tetratricopeptide (TPR) repeat protein
MRFVLTALLAALLAAPASAQTPPPPDAPAKSDRNTTIDNLLAALKVAPTEQQAGILEAHLLQQWIGGASAAARLLAARGTRELQGGDNAEAVEDFNALVTLEPELPEAYHQRAMARYAAGDSTGAIRDIERTLQLEPRHFAALALLSRIAEARNDWQGAYEAWKKVIALDPKTQGGEARLNMLRVKALGRET